MKKMFLLLCAITLAACSGDDEGSSKKLVPTTITLVSDDNSSFNSVVNITYDDKRRISNLDLGDDGVYSFNYASDKKIAAIVYNDGDDTTTTTVTYDSKGRINGLGNNGSVTPINYFDDGSFLFYNTLFSYTKAHDIAKYGDLTFTYDNAKKGAFANVSAYEPIVMALIGEATLFYATHKPLKSITSSEVSTGYNLQNTFNDDGYVSSSILSGVGNATINYQYEDL